MGAPKPDISTPDALKRSLLAARAIGYGNPAAGGAAGVHFFKVLERLGIVEEMKAKTKYPIPGALLARCSSVERSTSRFNRFRN